MNQLTIFQIALMFFYVLNVKHFYCDYVFRNDFIERKSGAANWFAPLSAHAILHGAFTFALVWSISNWRLAVTAFLFDAVSHFIIDRLKITVGANLNLPYTALLIADQFLHESNYVLIAVFIAAGVNL